MLVESEKSRKGETADKGKNITVISTFVRYLFINSRKTAKVEPLSLEDVHLPNTWLRDE
jgi:hypothetical protein